MQNSCLACRCLRPQWGASIPGCGPPLQASLLAAVFFLYGLNFGRTALFAGDALYAWGSLALQQLDICRHRCSGMHIAAETNREE